MKRLWVHEVLRVYYDRLVDDVDRTWIFKMLHEVCKTQLHVDMDQMFERLATPGVNYVTYVYFLSKFFYTLILGRRD